MYFRCGIFVGSFGFHSLKLVSCVRIPWPLFPGFLPLMRRMRFLDPCDVSLRLPFLRVSSFLSVYVFGGFVFCGVFVFYLL